MQRLRQQAQTLVQDILCGVLVPQMVRPALGANPLPERQILCVGPLGTASGAELTGWEETVYCDYLLPIPHRLVLQLPPELTPTYVRDRPGQFVAPDHVLWGQVLDADQIMQVY